MVWVRERTIPTERPPLVGEVITNLCGQRVPRGQRGGSLSPYFRFSRLEPLLFYQVAPQLYSRGWVDPVPHYYFLFGGAGNRTRASGSVAKNSDHQTAEAVRRDLNIRIYAILLFSISFRCVRYTFPSMGSKYAVAMNGCLSKSYLKEEIDFVLLM
jgi:hypothetical protein